MAGMPGETEGRLAFAGPQLARKVVLAFTVPSLTALLVLAVVTQRYVVLSVHAGVRLETFVVLGIAAGAALAMLAGAYPIRDAARTIRAVLPASEEHAVETASLSSRLDAAHKALDASRARLEALSFHDELTGLYNRRFFGIRLEEEVARYRRFQHPVSVVMMDLDGFKAVNDTLGHAVGDDTLREVAEVLLKHSRGINVVCRYGGDEFAVLLVETSRAGARLYGDRIRQIIASSSFSHGRPVTATLGIASLPDDEASTSEDLVRAADEALYVARRAGNKQEAMVPSPENMT
jgi:diguanylate cyclase (GGDEF)-like protein